MSSAQVHQRCRLCATFSFGSGAKCNYALPLRASVHCVAHGRGLHTCTLSFQASLPSLGSSSGQYDEVELTAVVPLAPVRKTTYCYEKLALLFVQHMIVVYHIWLILTFPEPWPRPALL